MFLVKHCKLCQHQNLMMVYWTSTAVFRPIRALTAYLNRHDRPVIAVCRRSLSAKPSPLLFGCILVLLQRSLHARPTLINLIIEKLTLGVTNS